MAISQENLEFLISQSVDGTLSPEDQALLQQHLANDPHARELLNQYQRLDAIIAGSSAPLALPPIQWNQFAGRISAHIAQAQKHAASSPASTPRLRLVGADQSPARPYRWVARLTQLAVAASLLIAAGFAISHFAFQAPSPTPPVAINSGESSPAQVAVLDVSISGPEKADGLATTSIAIGGPSGGAVAFQDDSYQRQPSSVVIASNEPSAQMSHDLPY